MNKEDIESLYREYQENMDTNTHLKLLEKESAVFDRICHKCKTFEEHTELEDKVAELTDAYQFEGFVSGYKLALSLVYKRLIDELLYSEQEAPVYEKTSDEKYKVKKYRYDEQ